MSDTLVVARLDRLARSLSHLLAVVEDLRGRGANFRSLADPLDMSGPSGLLLLQMLGAVAEFERALIRERTRAGLQATRASGRVGGHPGLRAGNREAIATLAAARRRAMLERLLPTLDAWLPTVRRLRPASAWPDVVAALNGSLPRGGRPWTEVRLLRAVRLLAAEGLAEPALLDPAPRRSSRRGALARTRAVEVAAALVAGRPGMTLAQLGAELLRLRHLPPGGGASWAPSSLKALLDRARMHGMLAAKDVAMHKGTVDVCAD